MGMSPDELMAIRVGGTSVADNIRHAVEAGALVENVDGSWSLAEIPPNRNWARVVPDWAKAGPGPPAECNFLIRFLFGNAYAEGAVPYGCRACYKIKVVPKTIRQLVAAWGIGKRIDCVSKWGVDFGNRYSQDIYAGYFYTSGLEGARALFRVVRELVDGEPLLGPKVAMSIKRGCSDYEAALGPSDKYEFAPELDQLEAYLKSRYREKQQELAVIPLAHWIDVAFRSGDDTYLDFTEGRRLQPKMVTYDPGNA